jgi:hypothetical protein
MKKGLRWDGCLFKPLISAFSVCFLIKYLFSTHTQKTIYGGNMENIIKMKYF